MFAISAMGGGYCSAVVVLDSGIMLSRRKSGMTATIVLIRRGTASIPRNTYW